MSMVAEFFEAVSGPLWDDLFMDFLVEVLFVAWSL